MKYFFAFLILTCKWQGWQFGPFCILHGKNSNSNHTYLLACPGGSEVKTSACNAGDLGSTPWSGRSPGEGNGNPLQYSCLENPMDRRPWWATVYWVAKSRTQLSNFTFFLCQWRGWQFGPFHVQLSSVQLVSRVQLFVTPWIAPCQASLSIINSWSSPKLMFIKSVMPSSHLILCHPLLLPPTPHSIRIFSNGSTLRISLFVYCMRKIVTKKQESSWKTSISALLTMSKPLTVWITINCGKF